MGFKCGIVGLPNVGKSTLFNALTKAGVAASNFPFCTIDPNVGVVPMPDKRLEQVAAIAGSKETVFTSMTFVDIAGLVQGAAQGEGLGNKFLANIRETQAIAHVVRCFENSDITHVSGSIDPIRDIEVINTELALADLDSLSKAMEKNAKDVRRGDKEAVKRQQLYEKVRAPLDQGQPLRSLSLVDSEIAELKAFQFLTLKPTLYIANVNEDGFDHNPLLDKVRDYASAEGAMVVPVCAAMESEIVELPEAEQQDFLQSMGLEEPGLNRVIRAGYELLGLDTYFTAGPKEARAWTIPVGASAPQAAGVIHSDFERGFIKAEVIAYDDYILYRGEQGAKDAGRWRQEGRDYTVKDGDVILFRFNV